MFYIKNYIAKINFNIVLPSALGLQNRLLSLEVSTKILYAFLYSLPGLMRALPISLPFS